MTTVGRRERPPVQTGASARTEATWAPKNLGPLDFRAHGLEAAFHPMLESLRPALGIAAAPRPPPLLAKVLGAFGLTVPDGAAPPTPRFNLDTTHGDVRVHIFVPPHELGFADNVSAADVAITATIAPSGEVALLPGKSPLKEWQRDLFDESLVATAQLSPAQQRALRGLLQTHFGVAA